MWAGSEQITRQTLLAKLAAIFHHGNSSFSKTKSVFLPQYLSGLCMSMLCFSVSLHTKFLLWVEAILMPQARLGEAAFAQLPSETCSCPCIRAGEQRGISLPSPALFLPAIVSSS